MSTYSASGECILQVIDPKSVDCSKSVKVPATSVLRCYASHVALGRPSQQTGQCKPHSYLDHNLLCRYFIPLLQSTDSSNFRSTTCRIRSPLAEYVLILHSQLKLTTAVLRFYYSARRPYRCMHVYLQCHAVIVELNLIKSFIL